ncbi:phosphoadenosine phosphosulfate reductase family protein [Deinococcus planocerae]|uniref:phosphoadenosine phosphosulfate reductase domain-containing protein n=1 Tax=Deinococcus planocerae TaxID=1737569 RepID=UPI000C7F017A|nr:phosphoadenosine phosphosulfate reductase family protein [Deinococcus planocerae]
MPERPTAEPRHILSLSGGKDSTALAIYMRDRVPQMEYVFCDTGEELKETYDYLERLQAYLGKEIKYLKNNRYGFTDLLKARNGYLPSPQSRWCTQYLKILPFEQEVGNDEVISYVALRADEGYRTGYISTKPNIKAVYPFKEESIRKADVYQMLEESGLGIPEYYQWRSRSGCYFCFYQQRIEWVGLLEKHEDLFWEAEKFEKADEVTGERYTWNSRESLRELAQPERVQQIKDEFARRQTWAKRSDPNASLISVLEEDAEEGCLICQL